VVVDGALVDRRRLSSSAAVEPWSFVADIAEVALGLGRRHSCHIESVLVAVPGAIDRAGGTVRSASNLPFRDFPLASALSEGLGGAHVTIEHDASCGVVGEAWYDSAQGSCDVTYITLSKGIGMGALVDGRLVRGAHGSAGELGHVQVAPDGRRCGCGARGCLEAYASGRALALMGQELLAEGRTALLGSVAADPRSVMARDVVMAAQQGDRACLALVETAAGLVGDAIRLVQRIIDPAIVVLGGGLMSNGTFSDLVMAAATPAGHADDGSGGLSVVRPAALGEEGVLLGGMRLLAGDQAPVLAPDDRAPPKA
jgi:glucokinase